MSIRTSVHLAVFVLFGALATDVVAQTREKGPWWPSPHGSGDQAGNSNYITAEKILKALRLPKTGQTYELGRIYEAEMPQYGYRPYFLTIISAAAPVKEGLGVAQQDYFTGFIGQMGTQFDAFGHQGKTVRMADGTLKNVYLITAQELAVIAESALAEFEAQAAEIASSARTLLRQEFTQDAEKAAALLAAEPSLSPAVERIRATLSSGFWRPRTSG